MNGARASVACRGSAQYTPRVGSHESREWRFTLRKTATDEWQIASARVARRSTSAPAAGPVQLHIALVLHTARQPGNAALLTLAWAAA